jgi:L-threonylcarbamoyladenylate synthase
MHSSPQTQPKSLKIQHRIEIFMDTQIVRISDKTKYNEQLKAASEIILSGGLVVFPTETVYGLGGNGLLSDAAKKIYSAKGRPSDNPLIIHIAEPEDADKYAHTSDIYYRLAEAFMPGPLTVIMPKKDCIPLSVTGGLNTVAVRCPSHPIAHALIEQCGVPIAAPSANLSGKPSPTSAKYVLEDMLGRVDMIIDGGDIEIGLESTIVDLTEDVPVILRPGYITMEMIEDVIGDVKLDKALMTGVSDGVAPKAPGMKYRHYAPKAELTIIEGERDKVINRINSFVEEGRGRNRKVGVMLTTETYDMVDADVKISLGSGDSNEEIARNLFATLREFDETGVDVIYSEGFGDNGLGQAVMNRLLKAAGHRVIRV